MARTKIPVSLRLDPDIKAAGEARAKEEMRSFASYLEWLIVQDANSRVDGAMAASDVARAGGSPKRKRKA